jgi:hypothetical protein
MSKREDIAVNIITTLQSVSSPQIKKLTRQPFPLEELAQSQYPAVLVQTQEETKEDQAIGSGSQTRVNNLEFLITGYVKGSESNIDTARNNLASAIETELENDITRNNNALDTEVISLETDAGTLFPYGAISMVVRVIYEHDSGTP